MLEIVIDNISAIFGGCAFNSQHSCGLTQCSSSCRLVSLFLRGMHHEGVSHENQKKLTRTFNFTFRYIEDALSLYDYTFCDSVDRIYPT